MQLSIIMRKIHRDIGAIVIGLTFIFALSGIMLIYRDTGIFKQEIEVETTVAPNLRPFELRQELGIRHLRVAERTPERILFENGEYNATTGDVRYTQERYPDFVIKMFKVHKGISSNLMHWVTLAYGIALLVLAISSFWMHRPGTKMFRRFTSLAGIGAAAAILALVLV